MVKYVTRFVPRARRPKVYSSAVVGFGGSSRSRKRNTIVDLPCAQYTLANHDLLRCLVEVMSSLDVKPQTSKKAYVCFS